MTLQHPLPSGFGHHTTAQEVIAGIDLTGKKVIVTGGHAGLGLETVRVLAAAGAQVLVGSRRPDRATDVLAGLRGVTIDQLDLSDPESVDSFAGRFVAHGEPLDLLINNAGIMATPLARDAQGHEMQLSTNYLGHFRLTARLWPRLVQAGGARIVMLTSGAHRFSAVDLEDPDYRHRPYEKWQAYGQSKTAAALFALELDARGAAFGVRAFSVHPGSIQTGLSGHLAKEDFMAIGALDEDGQLKQDFAELSKTIEQGAATSVWCATSPQLIGLGGVYCEDCDIANQIPADSSSLHGVLPWACDAEQARAWWSVSERLVGLEFSPSAGETAH